MNYNNSAECAEFRNDFYNELSGEDLDLYYSQEASNNSESPFEMGASEMCVVDGCEETTLFYSCFCNRRENAVETLFETIEVEMMRLNKAA